MSNMWIFKIKPLAVEDGGTPVQNLEEMLGPETYQEFLERIAEEGKEVFWPGKKMGYYISDCTPPNCVKMDKPEEVIQIIGSEP